MTWKALLRIGLYTLVLAAVFFLSSGRLDCITAWAYLGTLALNTCIIFSLVDPELLEERGQFRRHARPWDLAILILIAQVGPAAMLLVSGLDIRFAWSDPVPPVLRVAACVAIVLGLLLGDWAMLSNRFFSAIVRIQKERGHTVVTTGPYRFVRHPGYLGAILHSFALPLLLGSVWGLIPAAVVVVGILVRTIVEDRVLLAQLEGYPEYARRVRFRLLPGVW